jgi:hypothetical protein
MRIIVLALLGLPLGGCFGVTWPPPPLPEWAMRPQAEPAAPVRAKVAHRATRHRAADRPGLAARVPPTSGREDDVLPFSAEWHARQEALDAHLRRTMNICRGC